MSPPAAKIGPAVGTDRDSKSRALVPARKVDWNDEFAAGVSPDHRKIERLHGAGFDDDRRDRTPRRAAGTDVGLRSI